MDNAALVHHRDIVAYGQRHVKILFDQQNCGLLVFEAEQRFDQLINHHRRQALGRFVHQQEPALFNDGARNRQHLLLPAG